MRRAVYLVLELSMRVVFFGNAFSRSLSICSLCCGQLMRLNSLSSLCRGKTYPPRSLVIL